MYREGIGYEKDVSKAIISFEKSVQFGYVRAMVSLGEIYSDGKHKDVLKSLHYHNLASNSGHIQSTV